MSKVSYDYDSAAVRREAKKILACSEKVTNSALPRIKGARSKVEDDFKGSAAEALDNSLTRAQDQLNALKKELDTLYRALSRYADALEEADERVAQLLSK